MNYPVLIYDNRCSSCTDYARLVSRILSGRITMIGHYTERGMEFKRSIFPEGYCGLEMSWFVTESKAYGGSRGLWRLIRYALSARRGDFAENVFEQGACSTECGSIKEMASRTRSIIVDGAVIRRRDRIQES